MVGVAATEGEGGYFTVKVASANQCIQWFLYCPSGNAKIIGERGLTWPCIAAGVIQVTADQNRHETRQVRDGLILDDAIYPSMFLGGEWPFAILRWFRAIRFKWNDGRGIKSAGDRSRDSCGGPWLAAGGNATILAYAFLCVLLLAFWSSPSGRGRLVGLGWVMCNSAYGQP